MDPKDKQLDPAKPRPGLGAPEHHAPASTPRGHTEAATRGASQPPPPPPANGEKPFVAHYALKSARPGDVVRVEIDADANVLLVDEAGLEAYRKHTPFHYVGGGYHRGTALIGIPQEGSWHLIIDLGGRPGNLHHHVTVTHREAGPK
jgi:hypothetical protein